MRIQELLLELGKQGEGYPVLKFEKVHPDTTVAEFKDGTFINRVKFWEVNKRTVDVDWTRGSGQGWLSRDITGWGSAHKVLTTVINIFRYFIHKNPQITRIEFEGLETSRQSLYSAIIKRFEGYQGWKRVEDPDNPTHFILEKDPTKLSEQHHTKYQIMKLNEIIIENEEASAEEIIKSADPKQAYQYARDHVKGRWEEGESLIAQDPVTAFLYSLNKIKGPWPQGEAAIANDPKTAINYARQHGEFPAGEEAIARNADYAFDYALKITKKRFIRGEPAIASNPEKAYWYARYMLDGQRWPRAERSIMHDPLWAWTYARDIVKGRWPEGEEAIKLNPKYAKKYAEFISNKD